MSVYLHDIPLDEAKNHFTKALAEAGLGGVLGAEEILLGAELVGRILAEPVWAKISSPHYHASAMDGFCVRAADTHGATLTAPVVLEVGEQSCYLDTGDNLPEGFNAVIPIEDVEPLDEAGKITKEARNPVKIRVRASVVPWHHVRAMGEDMIATQLVLPSGHRIRPVDLGAIAGSGHDRVTVSRKPRVAVIPTGTELVEVGQPLNPGDIIEYNSLVLSAQVEEWGAKATRWSIVEDNFDEIKNQVAKAAEAHDLVLVNAGSSAGSSTAGSSTGSSAAGSSAAGEHPANTNAVMMISNRVSNHLFLGNIFHSSKIINNHFHRAKCRIMHPCFDYITSLDL